MIKKLRESLYSIFGEKAGEDIITKTISTATVTIGGFILAWLLPILIAYLVFIYTVIKQVINTPRSNWRDLIWEIILLIVVGLLIGFAILFKLHSKLSSKLTEFVREIKDEIDPVKTQINQIETDIDQINNTLQFRQDLHKENDFIIVEKSLTHIVSSADKITHQRRFKLKAMYQDLKLWGGRFYWTGDSFEVNNPLKNFYDYVPAGLKMIGSQEYDYYYLIFIKPLNRDEERDVHLEWELNNNNLKAQSRVSTQISEPTQSLKLTVSFAKELRISKVVCEISKSTPPYLVESNEYSLDATCIYNWRISEPIFGYTYTLKWD